MLKTLRDKLAGTLRSEGRTPALRNAGRCPACASDVVFTAMEPALRDHYLCGNCASIPRERALMAVVDKYFPHWRNLTIHESSPVDRGASKRMRQECQAYIPSQYFPDKPPGTMVGTFRCENLEALTFADDSIDLHISQDVLEHVFHPSKVFREIARTLKPGGAHVFTVPLVNRHGVSKVRARQEADGRVTHIEPPIYHGNPVSEEGALVTVDWAYDICRHIFEACGLFTHMVHIDDLSQGIRADLNEVLVTVKPPLAEAGDHIP